MKRVLVANRGEIAVRIIRTLREMEITPVAVYSEVDADAPHVQLAAEAYPIGPAPARESYLRGELLLQVARRAGVDGIHPGYGFLSENAEFAAACDAAGITFIGPAPDAIRAMGSKTEARARMQAAGVPVVPGGPAGDLDLARASAQAVGYPVLVKASAGGGGKGMRLVRTEAELEPALARARSEAERAFGDPTVYIEKAITSPHHVEIQVLGDQHGNVVHLFERDCSIQRRHQKVIEETPCPFLPLEVVERMGAISVAGARAIGYFSAGTFEFIVDGSGEFYFLEMNTRLQVEHPITELVTGVDLVREMIRVARGEPLSFRQEQIERRGAAIECRVYAEDPARGFLPSPGTIAQLTTPGGPFVRDDSGIMSGYTVTPHYDPLLSKLSVWAQARPQAIARMHRALAEYRLTGLRHNLEFHKRVMQHPDFRAGNYDTGFIERHLGALTQASPDDDSKIAAALAVAHHRTQEALGAASATRQEPEISAWGQAARRER